LYILNINESKPECWVAKSREASWLWHGRYGHVNFHALKKLADKEMVLGMPHIDQLERVCDGCLVGKQHRTSFPAVSRFRASTPLELLHGDLCGPITPATNAGKKYFLLIVDDFSRYMWIVLIRSKDEAFEAFLKVKAATEMELKLQVRSLRTDRGGEFTSREFNDYCEEKGIKRFLTAPYSPQQNGVVERRNQTVVAMARSLLKSKNLPNSFWGEAVTTAVYLLNRAPTKSVPDKTPYEAIYGRKPNVAHIRTFGCIGHVKKPTPHLTKLEDRSTKMVFIGYETVAHSKAYRMYDPATKKVHISRDVVFEEEKAWRWDNEPDGANANNEPFVVEFSTHLDAGVEVAKDGLRDDPQEIENSEDIGVFDTPVNDGLTEDGDGFADHYPELEVWNPEDPPATPVQAAPNSPRTPAAASVGASSESEPLRLRNVSSIYRDTVPIDFEYSGLCLLGIEEPGNYNEAKDVPSWRRAMEEELSSINDNKTWTLTTLPAGHKAIGLK
jgi:transposase InsO family protein